MSTMNDAELRRRLEVLAQVQPSAQATSRALDRVRQTLMDPNRLQARKSIGENYHEQQMDQISRRGGDCSRGPDRAAIRRRFHRYLCPGHSARSLPPIRRFSTSSSAQENPNTPVIHDMVMGSRIRRTMSNMPGGRHHHRSGEQQDPDADRRQEGGGLHRSQGPAVHPELHGPAPERHRPASGQSPFCCRGTRHAGNRRPQGGRLFGQAPAGGDYALGRCQDRPAASASIKRPAN